MLDTFRKRKDNLIFTFLILAIVAVMALYGVGQMNKDPGGGGAAAWVNGELISRKEFQQELERRLYQYQSMLGGQYDERMLAALQIPQRTLEELIQYKLLSQQSKKMDILVPDFELAEHIRALPFYQKDGKFNAEMYSKIPNRGVEEKWRRERLQIVKLQNYLAERVRPTPAEIKRVYMLRETKVDLDYAKIDFRALANQQKAPLAQVDQFVKTTPEAELKQYFDTHAKDFTDKGAYNLRQIRIGIPYQASAAKKAEAKKTIDAIAKEVNAANFAEVAKKRSDDEYAKKGGAVGWVDQGTLEKPIEIALSSLEAGQVSAPIETTFGYFIYQVLQKRKEVVHTFAESKHKVGEKMFSEKWNRDWSENKRKELDGLLAKGANIEPQLKQLHIDVKKTGPFSLGQGHIPNVGAVDAILDGVFDMTQSHPLPKRLFFHQDNYYFVKLRSVEYPKDADLAKNQEVVEKSLSTALQTELITQWVQTLQKQASIKSELKFDREAAL